MANRRQSAGPGSTLQGVAANLLEGSSAGQQHLTAKGPNTMFVRRVLEGGGIGGFGPVSASHVDCEAA